MVDESQPKPVKKRLPFGLRAIIVLQVLTVVGDLMVLWAVAWATMQGNNAQLNLDLSDGDVLSAFFGVFISAICAVGLWRRQRWAWHLTMLQLGLFMLGDLAAFYGNQPIDDYAWSMLFNIAMVFYLNQREVQNVFRREPKEPREVYAP